MVACQSWGLRTRYIGKVGHDLSTAPPASTNRRTANPGCAHFLPAQVSDRANQALRQPWHQRGGHDKRFSSSFCYGHEKMGVAGRRCADVLCAPVSHALGTPEQLFPRCIQKGERP